MVDEHLDPRNEHLYEHLESQTGERLLVDSGLWKLRSSGSRLGYGPVVGRPSRERDRSKQLLEINGNHRHLGRLGRLLRSRPAAATRLREPRVSPPDDRHFSVRTARDHFSYAVRAG